MSGKLITIEGINGMGKTFYLDKLREEKLDNFVFNREINDDRIGYINECIFKILSQKNNKFFDNGNPKLETLLIAAKLVCDEKEFIYPNLNEGKNVICDRGFDSLCILEGIIMSKALEIDEEKTIYSLYENLSFFCTIPNKTILLDGDIDLSIIRAEKRDNYKYTKEELIILKKCAYWYKKIAKKESRFCIINRDDKDENVILALKKAIK